MSNQTDNTVHPAQIDRYCDGQHPFQLSERQHLFTVNLHKTGMKEKSAIAAGYAPKSAKTTASNLCRNENVLAYLNELRDRAAKNIDFSPQLVLEQLWRNHQLAAGLRPIKVSKGVKVKNDDGSFTYETKELEFMIFNPDASNKSLELIGRHLAMFIDRKALEMPDGLVMTFDFGEGRTVTAKVGNDPDLPKLPGADKQVILQT